MKRVHVVLLLSILISLTLSGAIIPLNSIEKILAQTGAVTSEGSDTRFFKPISVTVTKGKPTAPFEGESIKIFVFTSFVRLNEWLPIDNYTSNGYDIKSILPVGKKFYVVLEKEQE